MKDALTRWAKGFDGSRRRLLGTLVAGGGLAAAAAVRQAGAAVDDLQFPGEGAAHKIAFQFNKADLGYQDHVIFSVGEMLRKYGDNINIVVVAFAEGIHILAKRPLREVKQEISERVSSLAQYGVEFHACRNTMNSLGWTDKDMLPFAKIVDVGAADLMELQEKRYAYISW